MSNALHAKVENALKASDLFCEVLNQETAALQTAQYDVFSGLQDTKLNRAADYQESVMVFEQDVDFLKSLDESFKNKLRAAHDRFTAAAEANQKALAAKKKVAERIVGLIMDSAKKGVQEAPNYGAGGTQSVSEKIPLHFKINEVL